MYGKMGALHTYKQYGYILQHCALHLFTNGRIALVCLSVCVSVCMSRIRFAISAPIVSPIGSFSSSRRRAFCDTILFPNFGPLPPPRSKNGPKRSFVQSFCSALHSQLATVATRYRWSAALIISHPTVSSLERAAMQPLASRLDARPCLTWLTVNSWRSIIDALMQSV